MIAALSLWCSLIRRSSIWIAGWVYLGMNAITQVLSAIILIPRQGDMLAERSKVGEGTKGWDCFLAPAIVVVENFAARVTALRRHPFWAERAFKRRPMGSGGGCSFYQPDVRPLGDGL